ncbi:hypothetical protein MMC22_008725 [Lobaria immixta]|nr:hypothetical protein [Lobaria immixta]
MAIRVRCPQDGHDFDYYPPLQGVANYMQQSDVPWKHAVLTIATLRSSNQWGSREKNVEKLLRLMSAGFARIHFSAAAPPRTQCVARACVSAQKCDGPSGDALGRFDIADRLTAIPNNNSVIIIVHGHSGLTADMHAPKESIWKDCTVETVYQAAEGFKPHLRIKLGFGDDQVKSAMANRSMLPHEDTDDYADDDVEKPRARAKTLREN